MAAARLLNVLSLWLVVFFVLGCSSETEPSAAPASGDELILPVTILDEVFNLELALDDATRLQGLSDRADIAEDGGMLFVFPEAELRQFVMRRCLVPIDIAFLDVEGGVVWMHAMQVESDPDIPEYQLKRYDSHYPAQFAVELRAGTIRRLGLKQGDRVDLPLEDLKHRVR